jgi:tetratricopeptide (TPR) repeat protein
MTHYKLGILWAGQDKGPEAEASYRAAIKAMQRLAEEHPQVPEYRRDLARSYHNMGNMLTGQEKWQAGEAAFRAAIKELKRLVEEDSRVPPYRQELAYAHYGLGLALAGKGDFPGAGGEHRAAAQLLHQLVVEHPQDTNYAVHLVVVYRTLANLVLDGGRPAQALEWYDKGILALEGIPRKENDPEDTAYLRGFRLERAIARAQLGQAAAVAEVEQLLKPDPAEASPPEADFYYGAARVFARAAGQATDTALAERYAGRAMGLLGQAVAKGYRDGARLGKEGDLDALRKRDDFQKLLHEVQKKK